MMKIKTNKTLAFLVLLTTISCSVQNEMNTDYHKPLEPNLNVRFYDKLDTIPNQYDNKIFTTSFIKLFTDKQDVDYAKPISLKLEQDKMFLSFSDIHKKEFVLQFYGKLHRKNFIFYTNYKTINFPVLLISKKMECYKICISDNNDLLVQKYYESGGMLLCFGAGFSYANLYRFKIL